MKPWILFLPLLIYSNVSLANLSGIWEGDYIIQSQADANNFVTHCNCETITGNLTIYGSDIEHVDSLYTLKEVQGSVEISSNYNLTNCDGLREITNIGKDLRINSNPLLAHLNNFDQLKNIGGKLEITDNYTISSIKGFKNLEHIGEMLSIRYNSSLADLTDFSSLQFCPSIEVSDHYNLTSLKGFNQLTSINKILIQYNESLTDIIGFRNIDSIMISLEIRQNPHLKNIAGFNKLGTIVETDLVIQSNNSLASLFAFNEVQQLSGNCHLEILHEHNNGQYFENLEIVSGVFCTNATNFQKLDSVATLKISNTNFYQDTLRGFQSLKRVGTIEISNNSTLKHIDAFNQFEEIGTIEIRGNTNLNSVGGFKQLNRLTGSLLITDNPNLKTLTAFNQLEEISENCTLSLPSSIVLENHFINLKIIKQVLQTNYTHFHQLDSIGELTISQDILDKDTLSGFASLKKAGTILIYNNNKLKCVSAFANLESAQTIHFEYNFKLTSITGFNNLVLIDKNFYFMNNPVIEELNSFHQLKEVKEQLLISKNNSLISIAGFKNLESIHIISIASNNALLNIEEFDKLTSTNRIFISGNVKLEMIPGFDSLKKIGTLNITRNSSLKILPGFNHMVDVSAISIIGNTNLLKIDGFKNLSQNNSIDISTNNNLLSINGFNQLRRSSNISIENRDLRVIDAFAGLVSVGRLNLRFNIQLRSIQSFSNLSDIYEQLIITDNLQLNQCCLINCWAEQGILETLPNPVLIDNNSSDCINLPTIKSACETTNCTDNQSAINDIRLSANPVFESLQFAFILKEDQLINYTIYTINDQMVAKGAVNGIRGPNNKTINLSHVQKGNYFLALHNEQAKEVVKFIRL